MVRPEVERELITSRAVQREAGAAIEIEAEDGYKQSHPVGADGSSDGIPLIDFVPDSQGSLDREAVECLKNKLRSTSLLYAHPIFFLSVEPFFLQMSNMNKKTARWMRAVPLRKM